MYKRQVHQETNDADELMLAYYLGSQRVEQLGLSIPLSLRRFLVVVNWPRVLVDTIERRQNVRSLILPSEAVSYTHLDVYKRQVVAVAHDRDVGADVCAVRVV